MEMSNFMPELHVAQQSRRDKLRVQHLEDFQGSSSSNNNNSNSNNNPVLFPSEMMNFPNNIILSQLTANMAGSDHHNYQNDNVYSWEASGNNELPLLPSFVGQHNDMSPHGLSLSLSSNQICEYNRHLSDPRELKPVESGSIASVVKQHSVLSTSSRKLMSDCGHNSNTHMEDVGGSFVNQHSVYRNVGPLGPFTGYATILRSSKFLRPAQQLLDEFLSAAGLRPVVHGGEEAESVSGAPGVTGYNHGLNGGLSGGSSSWEAYRPDCHEKKAKLLHMQEEVCKRQKQYQQQMQLVISAFESVPGLSNATPYISRSLKTISRHFRCLKNAITDQLKYIKRALGEDLLLPSSFSKGDSSMRYDQNFTKVKSGGVAGTGYMGQQNHVWRPQRGLPERAVSILRAWLFDHFLHPYPTDTDKQMLATQTGLSRNQVSNWFINARVRLWKPMVEEIHMLETKGAHRSEPNPNSSRMSAIVSNRQAPDNRSGCEPPMMNPPCNKPLQCLGSSSSMEGSRGETNTTEQLFQKCSRIENHPIPTNMDASFIGFLPYQRRGLELGGIGAVSLTLGLRHGSETTQQQLQHQFQQQGMHFGGHVIHDFSG